MVFLHVPDSTFGAVRMGYGRLREMMATRGETLEIVTPERFPWVSRVHGRWIVLLYPFAVAWMLVRQRRQHDVVLFHSYAGWVAHLARLPKIAITVFHGVEPLHFASLEAELRGRGERLSWRFRLIHGWLMKKVLRFSCRRSARVTCLNRAEHAFLLAERWTTPDRLVLLRHGVPDHFFVDDRVYAPRARRLLFVSQWIDRKGTDALVGTFTRAAREAPDLELWCVGTRTPDAIVLGAFPPDVRGRVINRPEATQSELSAISRESDIFLHLAWNEAYGRAIAEAMAGALPIICTPVGVAEDLLLDGENVLTVPQRDADASAEAILRLRDDRELRERLGRNVRQAASSLRAEARDQAVADLIADVARSGG